MTPPEAVLATIDAFVSVGADRFTITIKSLSGELCRCCKLVPSEEVRRTLPGIVADATACKQSVIIRPYSDSMAFVQLDDIDQEAVAFLASESVGFIALRTSPGSYQVWVALESQGEEADEDFERRLKSGMLADMGANRATRCGGSRNFKPEHGPNYPLVDVKTHPGRINTREQLEALGMVGTAIVPMIVEQPPKDGITTKRASAGVLPQYALCLSRAPKKADGTPDVSRADFNFALAACSWGIPHNVIEEQLASISARAKKWRSKRGKNAEKEWIHEVKRTVENAARFARPR
jgi:hypothetical protein